MCRTTDLLWTGFAVDFRFAADLSYSRTAQHVVQQIEASGVWGVYSGAGALQSASKWMWSVGRVFVVVVHSPRLASPATVIISYCLQCCIRLEHSLEINAQHIRPFMNTPRQRPSNISSFYTRSCQRPQHRSIIAYCSH